MDLHAKWRQNTESGLIDIYKTLIIWNVKQRLILTMPKYESRFPFAPSTYLSAIEIKLLSHHLYSM